MIGVGLLLLASCTSTSSTAKDTTGTTSATNAAGVTPCGGPNGVGGPVPAGLGPGDLVDAVDLTAENSTSPGFPTGARVWRVLYVSTGIDEHDLQLICGTVAAPTTGPKLVGGRGRLMNWTHGTVGLSQSCLPSSDPAAMFWGPMGGGINAISWGKALGKHEGDASGGLLQYALNQGMVVAASDYQPTDTYVVGKIAGSNALDVARAATQLVARDDADTPASYDMFTWGHSQGGHAALWTGQLAESYYAGTKPSKPTADIHLIGVAALAPASNFITLPDQPDVQPGDGLADWEMHQNVGLDIPSETLQVQIGPALFSYIFGSWNQISAGPAPAADAAFPAFPRAAAPLDMKAVVTPTGVATVDAVQPMCLAGDGAKAVLKLTAPYFDAQASQMLIPPVWNLPSAGYKPGTYFKGGLDQTCASTSDAGVAKWCTWLKWNLPGPLGTSPFPKAPIVDGKPVPLLIAQGSDDDIIHCIAPAGTPHANVPGPADCMSAALYGALSSAVYCPAGTDQGHLELDTYRKIDLESPGSHTSIPGQISAKGASRAKADLVFEGSPLQQFMTAAFDRSIAPGCSTRVMNPG